MKFNREQLLKCRKEAYLRGYRYLNDESKFFKLIKILYILLFIYTFIYSVLSSLSYYTVNFVVSTPGKNDAELTSQIKQHLIILLIAIALMIISFILNITRKYLLSLIVMPFYGVTMLITFSKIMSEHIASNGYADYFYQHGISIILLMVFSLALSLIGIVSYYKDKKVLAQYGEDGYKDIF